MADSKGRTVQLIYNPAAGRHCMKTLAALRRGFEDAGARVIASQSGPGFTIVIDEEASHVCAIGGDGTVRHVALAVSRCGRPVSMSVYPSGTVNLVHREMLCPTDPALHAARALSGDGVRSHYLAEIADTIFLACASVGPDSRSVAALSPALKRRIGKLAYAVAFLGILLKWRRDPICLRWDGGESECEAFYVAKGRYFAGPWSFAPEAELAVPLLHVVALARARRRDFARLAWALLRGKRIGALPGVTTFTCTAFSADADVAVPVQADGDIVTSLPVRVQLRADPMAFC